MSGAMRQTRENLVLSQPMCLCCLRSCVSLLLESVSNIFFHIFAFLHSSCSYFFFFWITMIERVCVVVFFAKILKSIHILALWKQREENWNVCRALSYGFGRMSLISTRFTIDKWRTNRNKKKGMTKMWQYLHSYENLPSSGWMGKYAAQNWPKLYEIYCSLRFRRALYNSQSL